MKSAERGGSPPIRGSRSTPRRPTTRCPPTCTGLVQLLPARPGVPALPAGGGDKHGIREHTRFNTEVEALWWDEDRQEWQVHPGLRTVRATSAMRPPSSPRPGILNRSAYPDLEGRDTFEGISIHSAEWDSDLDLSGKRVAIIGVGVPPSRSSIRSRDDVAHLTVFQRQPHWVAPRRRLSDDVPEFQRYLGRHVPLLRQPFG